MNPVLEHPIGWRSDLEMTHIDAESLQRLIPVLVSKVFE